MGMMNELDRRVTEAVAHFWKTRTAQAKKQEKTGKSDQGARAAVTGGAQMDGFIELVTNPIVDAGMPKSAIFYNQHLELPGFFRPTKEYRRLEEYKNSIRLSVLYGTFNDRNDLRKTVTDHLTLKIYSRIGIVVPTDKKADYIQDAPQADYKLIKKDGVYQVWDPILKIARAVTQPIGDPANSEYDPITDTWTTTSWFFPHPPKIGE